MKRNLLKCPCCGSGNIEVCERPEQHFFCSACLHRWKNGSLPEHYYRSLSGRSVMPERSVERKNHERLRAIKAYLRNGMRLLEIGCAEGIFGGRVKAAFDLGYDGIDPSRDAETAKKRIDGVWSSIEETPRSKRYDMILAFHVLEHIPDPAGMIAEAAGLLSIEGLLVVEVPNFTGNSRLPWDFNKEHIHLFSPASISCLMGRQGFGIEELSTGCYESAVYTDSIRIIAQRKKEAAELEHDLQGRFRNFLGARFVVYGAGGDFNALVTPYIESAAVAAIIDTTKADRIILGKAVQGPEAISAYRNDRFLIATYRYQEEIRSFLKRMGIRDEQIVTLEDILGEEEAIHEVTAQGLSEAG